uniref:Zmp:0000000624 n=1 Tax=Astatotilapia calliptera TaxID=8154 RepID=A0AAX7UVR7_ASTCA
MLHPPTNHKTRVANRPIRLHLSGTASWLTFHAPVCFPEFGTQRSSGVIYLMAKDKSLKSKPLKRKDLGPSDDRTEIMDTEVNTKRKKMDADVLDPPSCPEGTAEAEGLEDLSPDEKRVLERKLKKIRKKEEKKRLKAEGVTLEQTKPSGPSAQQQALDYLTCWAENRSRWKFQKTRQTWLLQHVFDSEKIPDDTFSVLLQYLEGLRGSGKDTTVQKALSLVEESGKAPEDTVIQQRAHRAREVIQLLS